MKTPLIEEGAAFMELEGRRLQSQRFDVIVIGAGQAGLSAGYYLAQHGVRFVILDGSPRVGNSWRHRWDSLRLFTPAVLDGLDGMPFPAPPWSFPTKDEMADYLEAYAKRFELPILNNVRVDGLTKEGATYVVTAGAQRFEAAHVIVAMASYQEPRVPAFAKELDPKVVQIHSRDYRSPSQLRPGGVLMVGAGNSGSEIALDVARKHKVWMSGRDVGYVPFRIAGLPARLFLTRLVLRFVFHHVLTTDTPLGRKVRPGVLAKGAPLIRVKPKDLAQAGVKRVSRVVGVRGGKPLLEDGASLDVENVIWCTGFHPGFSWIKLPVLDHTGEPTHERGVVASEPGLYFVGLHFIYAMSSTMIHGVGRDAHHIVRTIALRLRAARESRDGGKAASTGRVASALQEPALR